MALRVRKRVRQSSHELRNQEWVVFLQDEELGELSQHEKRVTAAGLYGKRYLRVAGISAMIVTRAAEGRLENGAVLLSRRYHNGATAAYSTCCRS